jgi:uncharacterized delta-60 repeat protein
VFEDFGDLLLQPDGKILVVGTVMPSGPGGDRAFGVVRLNRDGMPDASFAGGGPAIANFGIAVGPAVPGVMPDIFAASQDEAKAATLAPDGHIIVTGVSWSIATHSQTTLAVARFDAAGVLDTSFHGDGMVNLPLDGQEALAGASAVLRDGSIIVAAMHWGTNDPLVGGAEIVKLNADGSLDQQFGAGGWEMDNDNWSPSGLLAQADGSVLVAGYSFDQWGECLLHVRRYLADGTVDTAFSDPAAPAPGQRAGDLIVRVLRLADGQLGVFGAFGASGGCGVYGFSLDDSGNVTRYIKADGPMATTTGERYFTANACAVGADGSVVTIGLTSLLSGSADGSWWATSDVAALRFSLGDGFAPAESPADTPDDGPTANLSEDGTGATPEILASFAGKRMVRGGHSYHFRVRYSASAAIDAASIADAVTVSGPAGYASSAEPTNMRRRQAGRKICVNYKIAAPGGSFDAVDNGTYTIALAAGGNAKPLSTLPMRRLQVASGGLVLGAFYVDAPTALRGTVAVTAAPVTSGTPQPRSAADAGRPMSVATEVLGGQA